MDYIEKDELINRTKYILSISGIFDDLCHSNFKIDTISNMIVNRCNKNYTKEVIEENILAVLKDMHSDFFNINIDNINIIPLFSKLILENNKSNYLSIIKGYKSYFNEINYYKDSGYLKFVKELNKANSISVFSTLKNDSYNFRYCFYFLGNNDSSDYKYYILDRKYYSKDHNVVEKLIFILNLDKLTATQTAKKLNMDDVYYMDRFEEGFINTNTGIINPYKNPYIIKEGYNIRLLEGYTSIDVLDEFDNSTYKVTAFDYEVDSISSKHIDYLANIKKKMIKKIEEENQNGR